jgi:hypothetical protein
MERFKKLCRKYEDDWMEWDLKNVDYADAVKELKARHEQNNSLESAMTNIEDLAGKYGIETVAVSAKENKEALLYLESTRYDWLEQLPKTGINLVNCLVIDLPPRFYKYSLEVLGQTFKANFMKRTKKVIADNKKYSEKIRVLWFMGDKKTTDLIQETLRKRQIWFRVLRDSYLRRDFVVYRNGKLYNVNKRKLQPLMEQQAQQPLK